MLVVKSERNLFGQHPTYFRENKEGVVNHQDEVHLCYLGVTATSVRILEVNVCTCVHDEQLMRLVLSEVEFPQLGDQPSWKLRFFEVVKDWVRRRSLLFEVRILESQYELYYLKGFEEVHYFHVGFR